MKTDWRELMHLHQTSQAVHQPWVYPALDELGCKQYLLRCEQETFQGLFICAKGSDRIIGVANLSQIVHGAFQNAYLGYYVHADYANQGLMREGVRLAIAYAFDTVGLHRLEANIQPQNHVSRRLVSRLGFVQEGFSPRYLKINGEWRDHQRWALRAEQWRCQTPQ